MKRQGRFMAVLAILGLLLAILPALPAAGATAGTIALSGGVVTDGVRWYSTKADYNVATVAVTDADKNVQQSPTAGHLIGTTYYDVVGVGGGTSYTVHNAPIADRSGDGQINALDVSVRDLSGALNLSAFGVGGEAIDTILLGSAAPSGLYTVLASTNQTVGAISYTTEVTKKALPAELLVTCGNCADAANLSVVVNGTKFVVATQTATASSSETIAISDADITGTSADYWSAITSIDVTVSGANATGIKVEERTTIGISYKYDQEDTIVGRTSLVSSAHTASPIALTLTETGAGSGIFEAMVQLTPLIIEHDTNLDGGKGVFVTDGALLTFTYNDQDPVATKTATARADLKAPVIELVAPSQASYTNVSSLTFIAKITDEASADGKASGLLTTVIDDIVVGGNLRTAATPLLIGTNSFQVSYSETTSAEGLINWWFPVKDKVGNTPVYTGASAVLGAGNPDDKTTTPGKPFKVTIDTVAPTVDTNEVQTGGKLVAQAACNDTTASTTTIWCADGAARKAVTVKFALGNGTAPLDSTTLSAAAWRVAGNVPSSAAINTGGDTVVLTLAADQATDATPKVELVTAGLKDKAGNTMGTVTGTSAPTATDKLRPVLDVSVSPANTKTKVTITVTSSEILGSYPTIRYATNAAFTENATTATGMTPTTDVKIFTAEKSTTTDKAAKWWVEVVGTDPAPGSNEEKRGEGTPTTDVITFQLDKVAPLVTVTPTSVEEGDVFLRLVFNENEGAALITGCTSPLSNTGPCARGDTGASPYTDGYKKVTLTKATLTNKTTNAVEDVKAGFYSSDSIQYVLVKSLAKAKYDLKIEFADEAGNTGSNTTEITVTARAKTTIALTPGMNFVSLRGKPLSSNINDIIGSGLAIDLVVGYDATAENPWLTSVRDTTTGLFTGDLSSLEDGQGYIMRATAFVDLEVDIPTAAYNTLPGVTMVKGNAWSLIGPATRSDVATVDADDYLAGTKWSVCVTFNPDPTAGDKGWTSIRPATDGTLKVDRGYFCWFQEDGTIVQQ